MGKVSIFNPKMTELMEYLVVSEWNKSDEKADFASFALDYLNINDVTSKKSETNYNIAINFQRASINQLIIEDYQRSRNHPNLMRQRRMYVSPTLNYYQTASEEESNRVLRTYK